MTELLFAYGTLRSPDIQRKIVGKILFGAPDILEGYTTVQIDIDDESYPILTEAVHKNVNGLVLEILPTDFSALDEYEGDTYKRVKVLLKSKKEVWVYKKNE